MKTLKTLTRQQIFLLLLLPFFHGLGNAQEKPWNAQWIAVPGAPLHDYGVYQFRKIIDLNAKPDSFVIHVSADNRYKLYVNDSLVSLGPARGDIYHWNYETVDIARFLAKGKNLIAAVVWNFGDQRPEAQISYQTGFILQGDGEQTQIVNTNKTWKCRRDISYSARQPLPTYSYYVAGAVELVDYRHADARWKNVDFNDSSWPQADLVTQGLPKGIFGYGLGWMLVPRAIPQMELTPQRLQNVRKSNLGTLPAKFPLERSAVVIPANTAVTILLDQGFLTDAYPVMEFSKGNNATITLGYAEGLYADEPGVKDIRALHQKGNRSEIEGKEFIGPSDSLISNGSDHQEFTSLWWRTYRYMLLRVNTRDEPLTIDDLYAMYTGYPFKLKANFDAGSDTLNKILQTGWHTARLCAMETYMDCPYYEQLQYVGDTRIQCLVSLYNSGDDRLMRNAIDLIDNSRMAEGATLSRYPTANAQEIPPFSLWWIGMVHDYWMYRNDESFVKSKLPGIRQVLWFFKKYQQADGSLKNLPYWNFTDWCWDNGVAPVGKDGSSAVLDLQLLWAYQLASDLESRIGMKEYALQYKNGALQLQSTIRKKYWVITRGLFADTDDKTLFSQHANALAILTHITSRSEASTLGNKIFTASNLTQGTVYFKYYIHQALVKAGMGNEYLNWLDIWKQNLAMGMTTWAEMSDINNSRSDCHAWGASPNIEFYRTVLGIDSDSPGFKKIRIEPHLGRLTHAKGSIPYFDDQKIEVQYDKSSTGWKVRIAIPQNASAFLVWKDKQIVLKTGWNDLNLN